MKAAVLKEFGQPLAIEEVPQPTPAVGEVRIKVMACGIDGTDLKLVEGFGYRPELPLILGHETAGVIDAVGHGVAHLEIGQPVITYNFVIPPENPWYQSPREQLCPDVTRVIGVKEIAGGYAEYCTVPAQQIVPLPEGINWPDAAVLVDAGITAYHAVDRSRLKLGESVLVTGVGGVGSFVVQLARKLGARVMAVDRGKAKVKRALQLGAHVAFDADQTDVVEAVRSETAGRGVDCVLDIVGLRETLSAGIDTLAVGGRLVIVGYTPDEYPVSGKRMAQNELEIIGTRCGPRSDLHKIASLMADGSLQSIVTDRRPLEEANEALDQLRRGDVLGRLVLEPAR
ncbi:MAG: zinc-binding dehydrogenase [Pirellulales bacterium]|jgi:propanol-preferring alcohol dehydrogenase|nr:zinc-binding dehydrogenase [Pirellulales bacterium]